MQDEAGQDRLRLAAFLAREPGAARAFVLAHRGPMVRFARRLLGRGDRASVDDVVQEAFLAALRSGADFDGRGSVRGWLLAITRNACRMRQRRRVGEPAHFEDVDDLETLGRAAGWAAPPPSPEALASEHERRAQLEAAFERLRPEDAEVLLLRDIEGLSGPDTAEVLGLEVAAMKSRLHRARLRLAAEVRKESPDAPSRS